MGRLMRLVRIGQTDLLWRGLRGLRIGYPHEPVGHRDLLRTIVRRLDQAVEVKARLPFSPQKLCGSGFEIGFPVNDFGPVTRG